MSEKLQGEQWLSSRSKRNFDICVSSSLLPFITPIAVLGALAFSIESGNNPLFIQERTGKADATLRVLKLRTMPFEYDLSDASNGHADERANKVGRFLRRMTIDESPQIAQVLAGRMSIVGPRPLISSDVERTLDSLSSREQVAWLGARSVAAPGLLSDFGNMSRNLVPQSDEYLVARAAADIEYGFTASATTDRRIIEDALRIGVGMAPVVSKFFL